MQLPTVDRFVGMIWHVLGLDLGASSQPPKPVQPIVDTARDHGVRKPASVTKMRWTSPGIGAPSCCGKRLSAPGDPCCSPRTTMSSNVSVRPPTGTAARSRHQDLSGFRSLQSMTITGQSPRSNQRAMSQSIPARSACRWRLPSNRSKAFGGARARVAQGQDLAASINVSLRPRTALQRHAATSADAARACPIKSEKGTSAILGWRAWSSVLLWLSHLEDCVMRALSSTR